MKSQFRVSLLTVVVAWLFLLIISGCGAPTANAPATEPAQKPTIPVTATFVPAADDDVYVVAVLDSELLATAIPMLLSTPTLNEAGLADAPEISLALIDAMTWSIYRPIPNFSTSPKWHIPGLDVTTQEATTVRNLPDGVDSTEIAAGIQNYISNRLVGVNSPSQKVTPTPCPGPTPITSSELVIAGLSATSTYVIPFMVDYSRFQNALSSANSATSGDLLEMAGPYVATEIGSSKVVFEVNPFYGQNSNQGQIVFVATDRESLSLLNPPPDVILGPAHEITETLPDNGSAPKVIQSSEEFWSLYFGICPVCRPPRPAPVPPCMVAP